MKTKTNVLIYSLLFVLIAQSCGIFNKGATHTSYTSSFTSNEIALIMEADSAIAMRVLKIDNAADSIFLRAQSKAINPNLNDPFLNTLIKRMYATVTDSASLGVGIAAPQVGVSKKIILVQRIDKPGEPFEAYINPKILQFTIKKQDCREGCLSVPIIRGTTQTRAYAILVEYYTLTGKKQAEMIEGYTAAIFQHEIDHLNGILFFDHL